MRDPYSILGVKRDAGVDEIKAAWRNKAKSVHPDRNHDDPDANQRFAEVGRAYEVLKDPSKRSRYDERRAKVEAMEREKTIIQQREAAREAAERAKIAKANAERIMAELARSEAEKAKADRMAAEKVAAAKAKAEKDAAETTNAPKADAAQAATSGSAQARPQGQATPGAESPEDMVSRIFGESPEAQAAAEALRRDAEAASAEETTEDEGKTPARPTSPFEVFTQLLRRFRGGQPAPEKAPDLLVDANVTIEDMLAANSVTATLPDGKEVRVALEGGLSDGDTVRLKGQGLKVTGMLKGDVVVTIRIPRTERFSVQGHDIRTVLPITLENAVLGCETAVETPMGTIDITVPAWSNSDHVVTVENQGLPDGQGGRGALLVELRVMLWEKPDEKVTDLMRVMREGLYL